MIKGCNLKYASVSAGASKIPFPFCSSQSVSVCGIGVLRHAFIREGLSYGCIILHPQTPRRRHNWTKSTARTPNTCGRGVWVFATKLGFGTTMVIPGPTQPVRGCAGRGHQGVRVYLCAFVRVLVTVSACAYVHHCYLDSIRRCIQLVLSALDSTGPAVLGHEARVLCG